VHQNRDVEDTGRLAQTRLRSCEAILSESRAAAFGAKKKAGRLLSTHTEVVGNSVSAGAAFSIRIRKLTCQSSCKVRPK